MKKVIILILLLSFNITAQVTSPVGVKLIKHFEGFRGHAYLCPASIWTIGYGETKGVRRGMVITEYEASLLLVKRLHDFERYVRIRTDRVLLWNEFDALVSFTYNVGYRLDNNFKSDISAGNTEIVTARIKRYIYGGGRVLPGLVARRKSESGLYKNAILIFY